jgi:HSP20 family protein
MFQELSRSRLFETFKGMERLQNQLNSLFDGHTAGRFDSELPPLNIWTSADAAVITAELPGLSAEDIDVSVVNDTVTLHGSRPPEQLPEGHVLHRSERFCGRFSRSVQLPFRVNADNIQATFKNGILELRLPRTEQDKPRKITVQSE